MQKRVNNCLARSRLLWSRLRILDRTCERLPEIRHGRPLFSFRPRDPPPPPPNLPSRRPGTTQPRLPQKAFASSSWPRISCRQHSGWNLSHGQDALVF